MEAQTRYKLIVFAIALLASVFVNTVRCQVPSDPLPKHPPHPTEIDFWESLRILPLTVLHYDPATGIVDVKYEDKTRIDVFQLQVTRSTTVMGKIKGKIIVIMCIWRHGEGLNERVKYLVQVEKAAD